MDVPWDVLAGHGGSRLLWTEVPASVRARTEAFLGRPISRVESRPGGFSPGVAGIAIADDGRRVFLKAAGPLPNPDAAGIHRREILITQRLPARAPVPRLLWSLDDAQTGWVVLMFGELTGAPPQLPWRRAELERVLHGLAELGEYLTPTPVPLEYAGDVTSSGLLGNYWTRLAAEQSTSLDDWCRENLEQLMSLENQAPAALAGDALVHLDIRADNVLLAPDSVAFVDWPHARQGAAWLDVLFFAPSVAMQGGPTPDDVLALYPGELPERRQLLPAVAAIAGFFTWGALQPPPPGLPFLRQFQAAQGDVARGWLAHLLA